MNNQDESGEFLPLLIPQSYLTSERNKTGSWRFLRPRYDQKTAPCGETCPAGEDIGHIQMLTAQGLFKEAWEAILRENPFPGTCGRVCYHPCEEACNRGGFDEPVAIHVIERFLADTAIRYGLVPHLEKSPARKEKIAIVGSGPSGLSAAYFLTLLGYSCDVFERCSDAGGMLRWAIPAYRLPPSVFASEIAIMESLGIRIHCSQNVSKQFILEARHAYDALFIGCGQQKGRELAIEGEDLDCVEDGLEFLRKIKSGDTITLKGVVAIIGGGNTAIDVARSVLRLGGKAVVIYRRRLEDMRAFASEVRMAMEEGVDFLELKVPERIQRTHGENFLMLRQMEIVDYDPSGRAKVVPQYSGARETIRVSRVFKAIGAEPFEPWNCPSEKDGEVIKLSRSVLLLKDGQHPLVYGGDVVAEIRSVVNAVSSGKEAAMALDTYFQNGTSTIRQKLGTCAVGNGSSLSMEIYLGGERAGRNSHVVSYDEINTDYFRFSPRIVQPRLLKEERVKTFSEIDLKISAGLAIKEAERCFNCGLCNQCDNCYLFCPEIAVIREKATGNREINYEYCKGCGICVVECPRNAMILEEETA